MSGNLELFIEKLEYEPQNDRTLISGYGFNKNTKRPIKIKSNKEILYNPVSRPDLLKLMDINRVLPYGFMVFVKGDYRKAPDGYLDFESDKEKKRLWFPQLPLAKVGLHLKRFLNSIDNPRYIVPKIANKIKGEQTIFKVGDEYAPWIKDVEETLFSEPAPSQVPITYIVRGGEGVEETLLSIKPTDEDEIIVVTPESLGFGVSEIVTNNMAEGINKAVSRAHNNIITIVDSSDRLSHHFKNEVSVALENNPEADFIYADSDSIEDGKRYDVNFKPDFDEIMLNHANYILHPLIFKKELFEKVGGIRPEYDGLKDYDLILRMTKEAKNIEHLPFVLYHWNKDTDDHPTKEHLDDLEKGLSILNDYIPEGFQPKLSEIDYLYDLEYAIDKAPSVSIIIDYVNSAEEDLNVLRDQLKYLAEFTNYPDFRILAVNYKAKRIKNPNIEYLDIESESKIEIYNQIGLSSDSDYLCFINSGFKPIERQWLWDLVTCCSFQNVGIVGPKIFNEDFLIQDVGLFIDEDKSYSNGRLGFVRNNGYFNRYRLPREIFALPFGCFFIRTSLFKELGGFDTKISKYETSIDLSIRARDRGQKTVIAANTPVFYKKNNDESNGILLKDLIKKHGSKKLVDKHLSEHLKPSGSAFEYYSER